MLESMIREPRPTRAEAADVANAIIDGTDAVMLSGESAVGAYPVKSVEMMARIATEVEERIEFKTYPSIGDDPTQALSEAANVIEKLVHPKLAAVLTTTGFTARMVAAERPRAPVIALTADPLVYHRLNLFWGVRPVLAPGEVETFEQLIGLAESTLLSRGLAEPGDTVLIVGGIPSRQPRGSNFIKVHQIGEVRGGNT
jgi:pyruvate kinase